MDAHSIVRKALELPFGEARINWLREACGSDTALRARVDALLEEHEQKSRNAAATDELQATEIVLKPEGDPAASLNSNSTDDADEAARTQVPNTTQSVLKSMCLMINVPRVSLRELDDDDHGPITRPQSPEMPRADADSRYQLHGEIARGGMGAILKGRDVDLGRDLAIKVLLDQHRERSEVVQRFIEEAQIGGQLQHPGIAPVYELGQFSDGRPFFSMKLVKGQTLSHLLSERRSQLEDRARFLGIFEQVCQTMAYAHSRGVIHRDLKPSNVMVGAFGEVQVMDWGLAKVLATGGIADEKKSRETTFARSIIQTIRSIGSDTPGAFGSGGSDTQMGSVIGTPAYMPPEQALGEIDVIDERSDVFGLGAILCEILTGDAPYTGENATQIFRQASRGKLEGCFQRLDASEADAELIQLTKQCLELEPVDRPRNASEVAEHVTEYLESVETRLREAEVQRAAEAARADAEAAQAAAERRRAEAEAARAQSESLRAQEESKRRRTSLALAASILLLVGMGGGGWLYVMNSEAKRQLAEADVQRQHAADMQRLAEQRDEQRKAALQAEQTALTAKQAADTARSLAEQDREAAIAAREVAEAAKERGRRLQYATDMQLVPLLWRDSEASLAQLQSRLDTHNPELNPELQGKEDLRGFEWYYYQNLVKNSDAVFAGHGSTVADAAITSDGRLVTLSEGNEVRHWDLLSGEEDQSRRLTLSSEFAQQPRSLSPDGRLIALGAEDQVRVLDAVSGKPIWTIDSQSSHYRWMIFSSDNQRLVVVEPGSIRWLDTSTGDVIAELREKFDSGRESVALSHDGLTLALPGVGEIGQKVSIFRLDPSSRQIAHKRTVDTGVSVRAVAVSPDGRQVAIGAKLSGFVSIYETESGARTAVQSSAHRATIASLAFSSDGSRLASAGTDGTVKIWTDLESWNTSSEPVAVLKGHQAAPVRLLFSSDATQLITTSIDESARVWDVNNPGVSLASLARSSFTLTSTCFSSDGQTCAVAHGNGVSLFDTSSNLRVRMLVDPGGAEARSASFCPTDRKLLAVGYGGKPDVSYVTLWDIDQATELARLPIAGELPDVTLDERSSVVGALCFSPDGRYLVAGLGSPYYFLGSSPTPLMVWDVRERRLIQRLSGHTGFCVSLHFSSDGKLLASGSHDGRSIIWSTQTWLETRRLLNPDPPTDYSGLDGRGRVTSVSFSPDGRSLAMASTERNVHLWDVASGNRLATLEGHSNAVKAVSFSPDGRTLASCSTDGTIRLWNLATSRELMELDSGNVQLGQGQALAFSPDGKQLLAGGSQLLLWSAAPRAWHVTDRPARHLESLLASQSDFQKAVRLASHNPRLHLALEQLNVADDRVAAALAATRAHWHASQQRWAEAVEEVERLRQSGSGPLTDWLVSTGVLRVAHALLQHQSLNAASDLIAKVDGQLERDGITRASLIGIRSQPDSFPTQLVEVVPNTPAARAGLRVGDTIVKVNDVEITADNAAQFYDLLQGGPGTRIQLLVRHPDSDQEELLEMTKELVFSDQGTRDQVAILRDEVDARLARTPESADLLSLRAELNGLVGRMADEIEDDTRAIELLTSRPSAPIPADLERLYRRRGDAHLAAKNWQLALEDYKRIVTDTTLDEQLLAHHAEALAHVMLTELETKLDDSITDPWVRLAAAWQLKGVQPEIDRIVEKHPHLAGAIGELFLQVENRDIVRAIEVFSIGLAADSNSSELLARRARAYEESAQWDAAMADWSRAVSQDFNGARLLIALAGRLANHGLHSEADAQRQQASAILERLLQAEPNDFQLAEALTQVLLDRMAVPRWTVLKPAASKTAQENERQTDVDGVFRITDTDSENQVVVMQPGKEPIRALRIESAAAPDSAESSESEFRTLRIEPVGVHRAPDGGILGRYVRIDLPGVNVNAVTGSPRTTNLNLAEVQVFHGADNIAIGKDARMSNPTSFGNGRVYTPELAVDANTNTYTSSDSSYADVQPSWEVDLGAQQAIDRIVVWNRTGSVAEQLSQFRVRVLDTRRNIVFEQFVEKPPKPSTIIDCGGLTNLDSATGDSKLSGLRLRMPETAGFTSADRFRVSAAQELLSLSRDEAYVSVANLPSAAARLAAAFAVADNADQAVPWFEFAFNQFDFTHERRPVLDFLQGHHEILAQLQQSRPDDFDIQLAFARSVIARGKAAIASGENASGLALLQSAEAIISRFLIPADGWRIVKPTDESTTAASGSQLEILNDGSVFVRKAVDNDTFTLEFNNDVGRIRGLRLEALADSGLTSSGPGFRGSFRLRALRLRGHFPGSGDSSTLRSIRFHDAWTDTNLPNLAVKGLQRDGNWYVEPTESGKDHVAIFETRMEQDAGEATQLSLQIENVGSALLGRFRVSVTGDEHALRLARLKLEWTDSGLADFYIALGSALARESQVDDAANAFARALQFSNDQDQALKVVTAAAGNVDVFQMLCSRFQDNVLWQSALARGLSRHGDVTLANTAREAARRLYEQQLSNDPDHEAAIEGLIEVLFDTARRPHWTSVAASTLKTLDGAPATTDSVGNLIIDHSTQPAASLSMSPLPEGIQAIRIETGALASLAEPALSHLRDYRIEVPSAPRTASGSLLGRYVRMDLPGDNSRYPRAFRDSKQLNLAEVQVFHGERNLAINKPAQQSSTYSDWSAERAVDGNTSGLDADESFAHTAASQDRNEPWWEVDLGDQHPIDRIVIWNRTDGAWSSRMNHFRIRVLDEEREVVFEQVVDEAPRPFREINCRSLLTTAGADSQQHWLLRVPPTSGFESLTACRISVAENRPSLPYDDELTQAWNVRPGRERLVSAYAINDLLPHFLSQRPDDVDAQVALIRAVTARGLSSQSPEELDDVLSELTNAAQFADSIFTDNSGWDVLEPIEVSSENGSKLELQNDGSVFVSNPRDTETFTLVYQTDLDSLKGIRLEAFADPRLPGNGPGTGPSSNFVLTGVSIEATPNNNPEKPEALSIRDAFADYSQVGFPIENAIDDLDSTGWGVYGRGGKDHTAFLELEETQSGLGSGKLTVQLRHRSQHPKYLLGRFRISLATEAKVIRTTRTRLSFPDSELAEFYLALGAVRARKGLKRDSVEALDQALSLNADTAFLAKVLAAVDSPEIRQQLTDLRLSDMNLQVAFVRDALARGQAALASNQAADAMAQLKPAYAVIQRILAADANWIELQPVEMTTANGSQLNLLQDGSVFVQDPADQDTYFLTFQNDNKRLRGLRVEALTDPRLPLGGPGYGTDGGFVLGEISLQSASSNSDESPRPIRIARPIASHSQSRFDIQQVLDADPKQGWAIQPFPGRDHVAVFELAGETSDTVPTQLTVRLDQQWDTAKYVLGHFRLLFTENEAVLDAAKFRLGLTDSELSEFYIALGTASANQGLTDEAGRLFAEAHGSIKNRELRAQLLTAAAGLDGIVERIADAGTARAALARHYGLQGKAELQATARQEARLLLEQQFASDPEDAVIAAELADLLLEEAQLPWTQLIPTDMTSDSGAILTLKPDDSILASGVTPDQDVYTLTCPTDLVRITAIRLDALPDSALPFRGPGRHEANGNFHLSEVDIFSQGTRATLDDIFVTFAESAFPYKPIIDGSPDSGRWGIYRKSDTTQSALILTDIERGARDELKVRLTFSSSYKQHVLGKFRLSVSDDPEAFNRQRQIFEASILTDPHERLHAAYRLVGEEDAIRRLLPANSEFWQSGDEVGDISGELKSQILNASGYLAPASAFALMLSAEQLEKMTASLHEHGYEIQTVNPDSHDGRLQFAASWVRTDARRQIRINLTQTELIAAQEELREAGYRMVDIGGYSYHRLGENEVRFFAVWEHSPGDLPLQQISVAQTPVDAAGQFRRLLDTHLPIARSLYYAPEGDLRLCHIWDEQSESQRGHFAVGFSSTAKLRDRNRLLSRTAPPQQLVFEHSPDGKSIAWAGVWRSDRSRSDPRVTQEVPLSVMRLIGKRMLDRGYIAQSVSISQGESGLPLATVLWTRAD